MSAHVVEPKNHHFPVLPSPQPGEDYLGVCTRLVARSGCAASGRFMFRFTQEHNAGAEWTRRRVPWRMAGIAQILSMDVGELALCHTQLPYYEACAARPLSNRRLIQVVCDEQVCNRRYLNNKWKERPLRWCLDCVRQDLEHLGEPLWYVAHQLPGVLVCLRHKRWLFSGCSQCGWQPHPSWALGYPPLRCANGHLIAARQPGHEGALSLAAELTVAKWSNELTAWRPSSEAHWIGDALREIGVRAGALRRHGWQFDRFVTPGLVRNMKRHEVLRNWGAVLARVTRAEMCTPMDVLGRVLERAKVHPLAIAMCVKALVAPDADVLAVLRQTDAGDADASWGGRWYATDHFATAEHVALLHELIESERANLAKLRKSNAEQLLGLRLGVSFENIRRWLRRHPELQTALQRAMNSGAGAT